MLTAKQLCREFNQAGYVVIRDGEVRDGREVISIPVYMSKHIEVLEPSFDDGVQKECYTVLYDDGGGIPVSQDFRTVTGVLAFIKALTRTDDDRQLFDSPEFRALNVIPYVSNSRWLTQFGDIVRIIHVESNTDLKPIHARRVRDGETQYFHLSQLYPLEQSPIIGEYEMMMAEDIIERHFQEIFKEFYSAIGVEHGDISPEDMTELEEMREDLQSILIEITNKNR